MKSVLPKVKKPEQVVEGSQAVAPAASIDYSLYNLVPAVSKPNSKGQVKNRKASIVYHKDGKRFEFVDEVITAIAADKTLQFAFNEKGFAIGTMLPECDVDFPIFKNGNVWTVYSKDLTAEAVKRFSLDFNGKSTISFEEVVYLKTDGVTAAFFPVAQAEKESDILEVPTNPDASSKDSNGSMGDRFASISINDSDGNSPDSNVEGLPAFDDQEIDASQQ
ncbi:hypothetical protein [Paenibacillus validus]|uniref:hypothetical protein n=1 Tax=Paenibacillus validus TaxID=44253 RepID=UPI003D2A4B0F